jgi:hypothetical protein
MERLPAEVAITEQVRRFTDLRLSGGFSPAVVADGNGAVVRQ